MMLRWISSVPPPMRIAGAARGAPPHTEGGAGGQGGIRSLDVEGEVGGPAEQLSDLELHERSVVVGSVAVAEGRQHAVTRKPEEMAPDVHLGEALTDPWVSCGIAAGGPAQGDEVPGVDVEPGASGHDPLAGQGREDHGPAGPTDPTTPARRARRRRRGRPRRSGPAGDLAQGLDLDAGGVHVDHEEGQAAVACLAGVAAGWEDAEVGVSGARCPDLLSGNRPASVDWHRPGSRPRRDRCPLRALRTAGTTAPRHAGGERGTGPLRARSLPCVMIAGPAMLSPT